MPRIVDVSAQVSALCLSLMVVGCSAGADGQPSSDALVTGGSGGALAGGYGGYVGVPPVTQTGAAGAAAMVPPSACPVALFQQCKACHDGRGTAGTPMGLLTFEDFHAASHSNPSVPVFKMVQTRVHDTVKPMPPSGNLEAGDLAIVDAWANAGGPDCGFAHAGVPGAGGAAGNAGNAGVGGGGSIGGGPGAGGGGSVDPSIAQYLSPDGTYFIKEPPGTKPVGPDSPDAEYCFNLVAHNAQKPLAQDTSPFQVKTSEFYHNFDYKVPYTGTVVALSTKPIIDNNKVLHHWLTFHIQSDTGTDGAHQDEVGLQWGKELVTGWAPGGNPPELPPGVGVEMPKAGGFMSMEVHYFNTTGAPQPDRSGVRICVTTKMPPNVATLTWLGTEGITIPPNQQATATGTCTPGTQQDIHLVNATPHMHQLGTHMKTVINRKGGGQEVVVDKPFAFSDQRSYAATNVVHPGDTLTTTCTFQNTTGASVGFGTSTTQEMCYDFVYSYPAHSLPNPLGGGIEGSTNMCLR